MLQILIQLILIFFISFEAGIIFSSMSKIDFEKPSQIFVIGLINICIIARIWHFWLPINQFLLFTLMFSSILGAIILRRKQVTHVNSIISILSKNRLIFFLSLSFLIFFSSLASISYDEGLYHAGFIKWLNKYPEVYGLANVNVSYGFNSNWHLLSAVFNGYNLFDTTANCINASIILIFILHFLWQSEGSNEIKRGYNIIFLFFPLIIIYHLIDASADLIVGIFTLSFLLDIFLDYNNCDKNKEGNIFFWFYTFIFLVTVKMNAVLIAPVFIYFAYNIFKTNASFYKTHFTKLLLLAFLIIVPWVVSNIILSGYIVYPYLPIKFLEYKWTIPNEIVKLELSGINYTPVVKWAHISFDQAEKMNKIQIFILWFKSVRVIEKSILLIFFSTIPLLLWKTYKQKQRFIIILLSSFTLIAYTLMVPDIRFFFGVGFAFLSFFILSYKTSSKFLLGKTTYIFIIVFQMVTTLVLYRHLYPKILGFNEKPFMVNLVKKSKYCYPTYNPLFIGRNIVFISPQESNSEFCWDMIPCLTRANKKLRMINNNEICDGFYQEK